MSDHDCIEKLDIEAEIRQLRDDAIAGRTIVLTESWHGIGYERTRQLARELAAVAGEKRVHDLARNRRQF